MQEHLSRMQQHLNNMQPECMLIASVLQAHRKPEAKQTGGRLNKVIPIH